MKQTNTPLAARWGMACALATAAGSVMAQGAVVSVPGATVRGGSNSASVIVNGAVINAASGDGAVAETNIPGRSSVVRGSAGGGTAAVVVESHGNAPVVVHSHSSTTGKPAARGSKEHVNADMAGSDLANANFAGHSFTNVDLSGANLEGANLKGAQLVNVNLENANLSGANLSSASMVNVTLDGANTRGTVWTNGRRR